MDSWKKGAIIGATWSIVGTFLFFYSAYIWYKYIPNFIDLLISWIVFFPLMLMKVITPFYFEIPSAFFLNFIGWIIIGATIGYIIQIHGVERFKEWTRLYIFERDRIKPEK